MNAFLISHTLEAYQLVSGSSKPADAIMTFYMRGHKHLGAKDRRFISEHVYAILRFEPTLEKLSNEITAFLQIDPHLAVPLRVLIHFAKLDQATDEELAVLFQPLLQLSVQTLLDISHLARKKKPADEPTIERLATAYGFTEWMTREFAASFGKNELEALLESLNHEAPLILRANTLKCTREEAQQALFAEDIESELGKFSPFSLIIKKRQPIFATRAFKSGMVEIQDEGSQLISLLLNPKPQTKVLDACAGGGGKTLHLAALMGGRGKVFAYDKFESRFGNIRDRIRRSGAQNIEVIESPDAFDMFEKKHRGTLDSVLIDAPCTGSGTLRRNPDMKLRLKQSSLETLPIEQLQILTRFSSFLKPGGRVVYATCSLFQKENESVVESFLKANQDFTLLSPSEAISTIKLSFDSESLAKRFSGDSYMRLSPHKDDTDGFFAAILQKKT
ncbi:MAG: RsmB/NOP family class I SAM-dependent RNA methyltransferase [Chloroherpetonaceae bacterium]|nr:RsmB/NOP family class I SAM-dependent RNA methyltransferase [Chloroherpetonaceae bacterium]